MFSVDRRFLFSEMERKSGLREYRPVLSVVENRKGVVDVDTVKGCTLGMKAHPEGGCYGECYAAKTAATYGFNFAHSVSRKIYPSTFAEVFCSVRDSRAKWYRIGTAGDPSHDWDNTLDVCERLSATGKVPVIITKHWITASDDHVRRMVGVGAVVNTSTSGLDSWDEFNHRIDQISRLKRAGVRSVCRVVTCQYGDTEWARECFDRQEFLLALHPVIDNPLRVRASNKRVQSGEILRTKRADAVGGGKWVSLHCGSVYLGTCRGCKDQCGWVETEQAGV